MQNQIITVIFIFKSNNMKGEHQVPVKLMKNYSRGVHYQSCRMIAGDFRKKKYFAGIFQKFHRWFLVYATSDI